MRNHKNRKIVIFTILFLISLASIGYAEQKNICSLEEAITGAMNSSDRLSLLHSQLIQKEIEWIKAKEDIKTQENKIKELKKEITYIKIKIKYDTVVNYMDMVLEMEKCNDYRNNLEKAKEKLDRLEQKFKIGKASQNDLDFLKKEIEDLTSNLKKGILNFENKKETMSIITGLDIKEDTDFEKAFSYRCISKESLEDIKVYAVNNDFELYKVSEKKRILQDQIDAAASENKEKIVIPKEWIEGKNQGLKDCDDERYALITLLIKRDQAKKEEEIIKKDLEQSINDAYNQVKLLETAYLDALEKNEKSKEAYERAMVENKIGKITMEELEKIKKENDASERDVFLNLIAYNKAIELLNLTTSGAVENLKDK